MLKVAGQPLDISVTCDCVSIFLKQYEYIPLQCIIYSQLLTYVGVYFEHFRVWRYCNTTECQ